MADENETERDDDMDTPERGEGEGSPAPAASNDDRDDDVSDVSDVSRARNEERELQRDVDQQALEAENLREDELPIAGLLGLERWVQFAFVALAVFIVYVTDKLVTFVWEFWAEPSDTVVTAIAVAVGIAGSVIAYQNDRFRDFCTEVVTELSKVTWPTREETWYSTLVVLTASFIAAVYTGMFDAIWSKITDLIYSA